MTRAIILDRDGVINSDSPGYIKTPEEWNAIPGSLEAIARLNQAGFSVFVATNQSGVARGLLSRETLFEIHAKLQRELKAVGGWITEIFFCPHHPNDNCECRKPKPGMLLQIAKKYSVDLSRTYFIGDAWMDVQAAEAAGCPQLMVLTGKGRKTLEEIAEAKHIMSFENLAEAVDYALKEKQ